MHFFFDLLKTNLEFKTKVLRSVIFLCLFIVGIIVFAFSNSNEDGTLLTEERNVVSTNYIPGDSIGIAMNKEEIYVLEENVLSNKEISLGVSVVENKEAQQKSDEILEEYIKDIKQSFSKIQSTENVIPDKEAKKVEKASQSKTFISSNLSNRQKIKTSARKVKHVSAANAQPSTDELEKRRILLQTGKRFSENSRNIKVNIDGNQTIKSGQYVRLKTMEDGVIKNVFIPKYTPIMASIGFGENRLVMNVSSVRMGNEIISCNFDAYGLDGLPGLPVNLEMDSPGIEDDITNEVGGEVSEIVSRTRVGRMASNIFSSKKKPKKVDVKVLNNTSLMLIKND